MNLADRYSICLSQTRYSAKKLFLEEKPSLNTNDKLKNLIN